MSFEWLVRSFSEKKKIKLKKKKRLGGKKKKKNATALNYTLRRLFKKQRYNQSITSPQKEKKNL